MSKLKEKTNFNNIWNLLLKADTKIGLFLFNNEPEKKTALEWIYKLLLVRNIFLVHGILLTTLLTTNFTLLSVIFCILFESCCMCLYSIMLQHIRKKGTILKLMKWCEDLYDIEGKFNPLIHDLAKKHLESTEKVTTKVLKLVATVIYTEDFIVTFGFVVLEIILPEKIFPKFTPPMPFYLFKNQDNWTCFLLTMTIQTIIIFELSTVVIYIISILFTVVIHVLGYLDLINDVAMRVGREVFQKSIKMPRKSDTSGPSFEDWIKIFTDLITDVNVIISSLRKFYSFAFLSLEVASFGTLFICGLIFTVIKQQYVFAVGTTAIPFIFSILCFINEKILDKFDDINATLYDIPWYDLENNERKILLISLNCDKIQKGFTVVGIHNLTMERFGIVIKAGYTNLLVLRDLVKAS